jgi:hypothetical protein
VLRLRQVWARLTRLGLEPREVPCQMELPALDASTGDAPEPRQLVVFLWVAVGAWEAASPEVQRDLCGVVCGGEWAREGQSDWVGGWLAADDGALAQARAICEAHGIELHEGTEPPAAEVA